LNQTLCSYSTQHVFFYVCKVSSSRIYDLIAESGQHWMHDSMLQRECQQLSFAENLMLQRYCTKLSINLCFCYFIKRSKWKSSAFTQAAKQFCAGNRATRRRSSNMHAVLSRSLLTANFVVHRWSWKLGQKIVTKDGSYIFSESRSIAL